MPAPDTWSAYYRRTAADEAAAGHHGIAAVCLRDARRAAFQERQSNHSGAFASFRERNHV